MKKSLDGRNHQTWHAGSTISVLVCARGRHQIGWQEPKCRPQVQEIDETRSSGGAHVVFSITCIWDALKANVTKLWLMKTKECSNRAISAGATENSLESENMVQTLKRGSNGRGKTCEKNALNDFCEFANKAIDQLLQVSTSCFDDPSIQKENELETTDLLSNCPEMSALGTHRKNGHPVIDKPNWHVQSQHACAKRLACLISYTHNTSDQRQ